MAISHTMLTCTGILFLTFAVLASCDYPKNAESQVRDYLLHHVNYSARYRPVLDYRTPVNVTLNMEIYAMLDLNERDQVITTASWVIAEWRDERLTWNPEEFDGVDLLVMFPDEIWIPKVLVVNSVNTDSTGIFGPDRGSILLTSEGDVHLGISLAQSTQCHISIRYFPFDTQACPFVFLPINQIGELTQLYLKPSRSPSSFASSEWNILNITTRTWRRQILEFVPNRPSAEFYTGVACLHIRRHPLYFVFTLVIPSSLLCFLALLAFLAPPDCGERISLSVSVVLGLTIFQVLVNDALPHASKDEPIVADYLILNFVLGCLAVPFSLVNINIAYGDSSITLLKRPRIRHLLLHNLPNVLWLPTYNERVKDDNVIRKPVVIELEDLNGSSQKEVPQKEVKSKLIKHETQETMGLINDQFTENEKRKLEARTVALVMDRLVLIGFLIFYLALVLSLIIQLSRKPEVTFTECDQ